MEGKIHVAKEQLKSIAGGDGFSGIVVIAFVIAMIIIRVPIDISVFDL